MAWCSAFVNWLFLEVTGVSVARANARSWLNVREPFTVRDLGTPDQGIPGDVVVLWRSDPNSWKGHVGLFVRATGNRIWLLGGNQSGRVSIKRYPIKRVLAVRRFSADFTDSPAS